jgi:hypothetical protein
MGGYVIVLEKMKIIKNAKCKMQNERPDPRLPLWSSVTIKIILGV